MVSAKIIICHTQIWVGANAVWRAVATRALSVWFFALRGPRLDNGPWALSSFLAVYPAEPSVVSESSLPALAKKMQAAALDPTCWEPALNAANEFTGGGGVVLLSVSNRLKSAPTSTDIAGMMDDYFSTGWYLRDGRDVCIPQLKQTGLVLDRDFQAPEDIVRSDFYNDFLARYHKMWFAGVAAEVDGDFWCLAFQRSPEAGAFGSADTVKLKAVRGLLVDAARVSRHIGSTWLQGHTDALQLMRQPAFVLDFQARIVACNERARQILSKAVLRDRQLTFRDQASTDAFNEMLRRAFGKIAKLSQNDIEAKIHLEDNIYRCQAISLLDERLLIGSSGAVLVTLHASDEPWEKAFKTRHGLTIAETKVAVAVAEGKNAVEIALTHRVAIGTVRAQIKAVLAKTETSRQAQFAAMVAQFRRDRAVKS